VARVTPDGIVAGFAANVVAALPAVNAVVAALTADEVVPITTVDDVVAGCTDDHIHAAGAVDRTGTEDGCRDPVAGGGSCGRRLPTQQGQTDHCRAGDQYSTMHRSSSSRSREYRPERPISGFGV